MLGELGWLEHDQRIGRAVWLAGVILYLASIVGGIAALNRAKLAAESSEEADESTKSPRQIAR